MLELRQGRKKDCRRGEEEEGESREPQVPWQGAGAAPLPGLGSAQKRENPRNLRFLGRVQGRRPCQVWAAPSVPPSPP